MPLIILAAAAIGLAGAGGIRCAEEPVNFSRDVLPLLSKNCFRCHGPDEEVLQAGLRLDLREQAVAKLDSGSAAIVPGKPEASELIKRVSTADADLRMPPLDGGLR